MSDWIDLQNLCKLRSDWNNANGWRDQMQLAHLMIPLLSGLDLFFTWEMWWLKIKMSIILHISLVFWQLFCWRHKAEIRLLATSAGEPVVDTRAWPRFYLTGENSDTCCQVYLQSTISLPINSVTHLDHHWSTRQPVTYYSRNNFQATSCYIATGQRCYQSTQLCPSCHDQIEIAAVSPWLFVSLCHACVYLLCSSDVIIQLCLLQRGPTFTQCHPAIWKCGFANKCIRGVDGLAWMQPEKRRYFLDVLF